MTPSNLPSGLPDSTSGAECCFWIDVVRIPIWLLCRRTILALVNYLKVVVASASCSWGGVIPH